MKAKKDVIVKFGESANKNVCYVMYNIICLLGIAMYKFSKVHKCDAHLFDLHSSLHLCLTFAYDLK